MFFDVRMHVSPQNNFMDFTVSTDRIYKILKSVFRVKTTFAIACTYRSFNDFFYILL